MLKLRSEDSVEASGLVKGGTESCTDILSAVLLNEKMESHIVACRGKRMRGEELSSVLRWCVNTRCLWVLECLLLWLWWGFLLP